LLISVILLSVGSILNYLYIHEIQREKIYSQKVSKNIQRTLDHIQRDHSELKKYYLNNNAYNFSDLTNKIQNPTYVYRNNLLIYWSSNQLVPPESLLRSEKKYTFIQEEDRKSLAILEKVTNGNDTISILSIIPLYVHYDISNEFLESGYNSEYFESSELEIHDSGDYIPIKNNEGNTLFFIEFLNGYVIGIHWLPMLIFSFIFIGILLLLLFLIGFSVKLYNAKGFWHSAIFLILSLNFVRMSILMFGFPFSYLNFDIFNSKYYASSFINPSLGDLIINMLFLVLIAVFIFTLYVHKDFVKLVRTPASLKKNLVGIFSILLFLISSLFIYKLIQSLGTHSQWSMNIASGVNFTTFRWISFFLYALSVFIYILFTYILNKIIWKIYNQHITRLAISLISVLVLFSIAGFLYGDNLLMIGIITVVFVLFSFYINIKTIFSRFQYKTFVYLLAVFIFTSLIGSLAINDVRKNLQNIRIERFGEQLIQENDPLAEFFLAEAAEQIQNDVFIKNRLFSPFVSKEIIEEKIRRVHLNNYLDKYDIIIFLYNSRGEPLYAGTPTTYHKIKELFALDIYKTDHDNLYFLQQEKPELLKRYLEFIPVNQYNTTIGYIILDLKLKKIIPTKVYPRLLLDEPLFYFEDQYDFALYKNDTLINSSGNFNYDKNFDEKILNNNRLFQGGIRSKNFIHYGFRVDRESVYVISNPVYPYINFFANFSFLFLILAFCFLVTLIAFAVYYNVKGTEINYVTRIQLYLNLAFFIPLSVISVTTLTRSTADYKNEVEREYLRTAEAVSNNITEYLQNFLSNISSIEELSSKLSELANFSELDMDIFRTLQNPGRLLVSTQPLIYDKGILSELVDPHALSSIKELGDKSIILNETFGKLDYKTAYVSIRSTEDGQLIGILSIPFFGSQEAIEQNLTGLVINILSIFTIIFISFIFLSFFVSNYLTFPLKFLTDKLRKTSLTGSNEPIHYESADEIGQLVSEYNNMLLKLEESKKALARTEKEAAWREIAKQVAHEIKNPLTPMKLTLQHLKMRVSGDSDEKAKIEKSINSLLHNIETLSDIATSFSNYAQMPVPEKEKFDIVGLLRQTVNIYITSEEDVDIKINIPEKVIMVEGDPGWIGRSISNLIINGIQAVTKGHKPRINIMLEQIETSKVLISTKDNGMGIREEIRDKIFMPNFSTKYSGSGIGLAIAKRAIEHAKGKIWYDTNIGKGTTFFIELPVVF